MSENINLVVIVGEHQPHQERKKTVKTKGRPKNMSEKIEF